MKTITSTNARKQLKSLLELVAETGEIFAIGRHKHLDALLIKFPRDYHKDLTDITNINAYSSSFGFLAHEPELYSVHDIRRTHGL